MTEIETMSHVELLNAYADRVTGKIDESESAHYAEILRRMDSAATSRRGEIEPHSPDHRR